MDKRHNREAWTLAEFTARCDHLRAEHRRYRTMMRSPNGCTRTYAATMMQKMWTRLQRTLTNQGQRRFTI